MYVWQVKWQTQAIRVYLKRQHTSGNFILVGWYESKFKRNLQQEYNNEKVGFW